MLIKKSVADLIDYVDERNTDGSINDFYGINIQKEFMPTLASTDSVDPTKYKVVRNNRFVFSGMQTGRDKCIRIGLYKGDPIVVSPAYQTFEIKDTAVILPEYFFMQFLSDEMDRYGWFISDSSIRANLDLDRFVEIAFEIPDIHIQQKYVDIYNAIKRVKSINARIKQICPVLVRSAIKEAEQ